MHDVGGERNGTVVITGSDIDEAGSVSRAGFETLKQDFGNKLAQLQLAPQRNTNDVVSDRCHPPPLERGSAGAAGIGTG